jgi:hypothetical protein
MSSVAESVVGTALLLLAPAALHLGALRGAPLRPKRLRPEGAAEGFLFKQVYWTMLLSGVLLAATFLMWRASSSLWIMLAAIASPVIIAQIAALVIAKSYDVRRGGAER